MLPDYVLAYKKKGYKIKEVNNHYYLYKVTSSRIPGYKYPQEKDIYLGVITEYGLSKPKKVPSNIRTYEYGISMYLISLANKYLADYANVVKVKAVLSIMYGIHIFDFHYKSSYLSILYPNIKITPLKPVDKEATKFIIPNIDNYDYAILYNIRMVKIDDKFTLTTLTEKQKEVLTKYNINMEL